MEMRSRVRRWRIRKGRTACILDDVDLFSECTVNQLRSVAQLVCPISVTRDRLIVEAGEPCDQLVLVLSGEAGTSTPGGGEGVVGPGSVFGEQALLPGSVEIASVTAKTAMDLVDLEAEPVASVTCVDHLRALAGGHGEPLRAMHHGGQVDPTIRP